jgi:type II pantothenate kinase
MTGGCMGIVIGLDIGGSTTKIIGINKHELLGTTLVRASDPVASAFGAFGKFTNEHAIDLKDIDRVTV